MPVMWTLLIMDQPLHLQHPLPTAEVSFQNQNRIIFSELFDCFRGSTDFERRPLVSKTNFPTCTTELFCEPTPVQFLQLVLNKCITYFLWKWGPLFSKYICGVNIFCIFLNSFFFQKLHFTQSKNW